MCIWIRLTLCVLCQIKEALQSSEVSVVSVVVSTVLNSSQKNSLSVQDHRFGGIAIDGCSNLNFHGPYEQTWLNAELPYTQGKILAIDDSANPGTMTVQASRLVHCKDARHLLVTLYTSGHARLSQLH